ncbi:MAG: sigma-70 family RNA polymerase sigma factor [Firmicutes bacterium]|nr:sigma-70 family RNA polymerase sigma factor [Bacillota bacterium]
MKDLRIGEFHDTLSKVFSPIQEQESFSNHALALGTCPEQCTQSPEDTTGADSSQETWTRIDTWVRLAQQGDTEARAELCTCFTPLVHACAKRYRSARLQWDDLIQCGYESLLRAIATYDISRGVHFAHYAKIKVRGGIYSCVRSDERTDRRERLADTGAPGLSDAGAPDRNEESWVARIPDEQAQSAFARIEWEELLVGLSARERLAVIATVIGDDTTGELASQEGVGRESAKTWRKRGLAKLRRAYASLSL